MDTAFFNGLGTKRIGGGMSSRGYVLSTASLGLDTGRFRYHQRFAALGVFPTFLLVGGKWASYFSDISPRRLPSTAEMEFPVSMARTRTWSGVSSCHSASHSCSRRCVVLDLLRCFPVGFLSDRFVENLNHHHHHLTTRPETALQNRQPTDLNGKGFEASCLICIFSPIKLRRCFVASSRL